MAYPNEVWFALFVIILLIILKTSYMIKKKNEIIRHLKRKNPKLLKRLNLPGTFNLNPKKEIAGIGLFNNIFHNSKNLPHDKFLDRIYKQIRIGDKIFNISILSFFIIYIVYLLIKYNALISSKIFTIIIAFVVGILAFFGVRYMIWMKRR